MSQVAPYKQSRLGIVKIGWLVVLGLTALWAVKPQTTKQPILTKFRSISGCLPERGRKSSEKIEETEYVQTTPPAPTACAIGPFPTIIKL